MSNRYRHQTRDIADVKRGGREQIASFGAPILAVVIIGSVFYTILYSSLFEINQVEVEGNTYVDAQLIEAGINAQKSELRFWILPQSNILAFDEVAAINKLSHPRIADITIKRKLPHTLVVSINEKAGVAEWEWQGRWFELDDECTIIGEVGGPTTGGLSLRNTQMIDIPVLGTKVCDQNTLELVKTIDANIPQGFNFEIRYYDIANLDEYYIDAETNEKWYMRLSTQLTIAEQMDKLNTFLVSKGMSSIDWSNDLTYIDLRYGNSRIYYR